MPIYEYECPRCGVFEVSQRITEDPLGRCPSCRSKVRKLISQSSFALKGDGWYVTDYARKGDGASGAKEEKGKKPDKGVKDAASGAKPPAEKAAASA